MYIFHTICIITFQILFYSNVYHIILYNICVSLHEIPQLMFNSLLIWSTAKFSRLQHYSLRAYLDSAIIAWQKSLTSSTYCYIPWVFEYNTCQENGSSAILHILCFHIPITECPRKQTYVSCTLSLYPYTSVISPGKTICWSVPSFCHGCC